MNRDFKKLYATDNKMQGLMSIGSSMDFSDLPTAFTNGKVDWDKMR
jgi:hypothetical protein